MIVGLMLMLTVGTVEAKYMTNFRIKNGRVYYKSHKKKRRRPKDPFDIVDKYARSSRIRRNK